MAMIYADFLRETGWSLFEGGNTWWRLYKGVLVPASPVPEFLHLELPEAKQLLLESKADFIRWSSDPCEGETSWWWVVCGHYDLADLTSKMRNQINRGHRKCTVRRIDAEWLAENGYRCFKSAYRRYRHAAPLSEGQFRAEILQTVGYESLFEFWGVFFEEQLVGYVLCVVEDGKGVATVFIKYDPALLQHYPAYAMTDALLSHYVAERGMPLSNGTRSIGHDTSIQDFLLKFGFKRQYCRLNIVYAPLLELGVRLAYPLIFVSEWLDAIGIGHRVHTILLQESFRRESSVKH